MQANNLQANGTYSDLCIAVIGDYMLDEWWSTDTIRICPEAPVPDLINPILQGRSAGGAGNVARNLLALGAKVDCYGLVGTDKAGRAIREQLIAAGADWRTEPANGFGTHKKIRYTSDGQIMFRVSMDASRAIPYPRCVLVQNYFDAVIVSDYNKGMLNPTVIETVMGVEIPVFVDPKYDNFWLYKGAEVIKCNAREAVKAMHTLNGEYSVSFIRAGLEAKNAVVTLGHAGMEVCDSEDNITDIPGRSVTEVDVTGAGDTAIAVLTLEYLRTKDIVKAAFLANYACSLVVQKRMTGIVTLGEIKEALGNE